MHVCLCVCVYVCMVCMVCIVCLQVESRAHSIWGGEEGLLAEQQRKAGNREKIKQKKYERKIKGGCYPFDVDHYQVLLPVEYI